ncbi:MAG: D-alanyl-D-alanine carboxypeptidase family protein [Pseudomonadota bacterium]
MYFFRLLAAAAAFLVVSNSAHARPQILVDADRAIVLAHTDAFQRWHPASITKLMTAYVIFRAIKAGEITLESPVRVSKNALSNPPSKMGLPEGTILNFDNALKMLIVKSANDIAVAIGESLSGTESAFVARMNQTAKQIGMLDTNFVNPHGLHHDLQYTTARDMAVLAIALHREFPQYGPLFRIKRIRHGKAILKSHNPLTERFSGSDGFKTGYICAGGYNLVGSATRNGRRLVTVVLGATHPSKRAVRAGKLLTEGFDGTLKSATPLANFRPYGANRKNAISIRDEVCSRKKRKTAKRETRKKRRARLKRELERREAEEALYLTPPVRTQEPVRVVLGGAFGPSPVGIRVANGATPPPYIAVPKPRPDYQLARIDDLPPFSTGEKGKKAIPPRFRPTLTN